LDFLNYLHFQSVVILVVYSFYISTHISAYWLSYLSYRKNMKLTPEQKEKKKRIAEKLSIRVIWTIPPKEKKGATWEFELFKKIALERCSKMWIALAKHITPEWDLVMKPILMDYLTVTNFSHIIWKGRDKTKRLDPDNIEIVSRSYHEWQHTKQIPQQNYVN